MRKVLDAELAPFPFSRLESPWPERIERAADEVFSRLLPGKAKIADSLAGRYGDLTAVVSLTGAISASLSICCSSAAARNIAGRMLGVPEPSEEQIQVTLGELAHRIARTILREAAGPVADCLLTPPIVIGNGFGRQAGGESGSEKFGEGNDDLDPLEEAYLIAFEFLDFPIWLRFAFHD